MARRADPQITSVRQCAICLGAPEENVLPKYVQMDPTKPPIPIPGDEEDMYLYEDEQALVEEAKRTGKPWTGILRPLFRFFGLEPKEAEKPKQPEKSRSAAKKKKSGGLFER